MEILREREAIPNHFLCAEERVWQCPYEAHGHDFFEMEYILSGSGSYEIDGIRYLIAPDTVFLMTPARIHAVSGVGCKAVNIAFGGDFFRDDNTFFLLSDRCVPRIQLSAEAAGFVRGMLRELIDAQRGEREYAALLLRCVLQKLAFCSAEKEETPVSGYLRTALVFLSENFRQPLTLKDAAEKVGLSRAYFSDLFSRQIGIPYKTYLDNLRFSYVCKLLMLTDLTVAEICTRSGFENYANFMRRFRKRYGVSPLSYRLQEKR